MVLSVEGGPPSRVFSYGELRKATNEETQLEDEKKATIPLPAGVHDPQRVSDGVHVPDEACECYPDLNVKNGKKRGLAVIISMEKYGDGKRSGGSEDRENLKALARSLHFEDHAMVDYTVPEVRKALRSIAEGKVSDEHESFVCFVNGHGESTHGDNEQHFFRDQDDDLLFLEDIVAPFRMCKQLRDKPKVFFVNSCRGGNMLLLDGVLVDAQGESSAPEQPTGPELPKEAREYKYLREIKDCLIVFSTSGQAVSTRYAQAGTTFVCALTSAFMDKRERLDVVGIVCCATNEVVAQQHEWKKKGGAVTMFGQCPVYVSSLTKLLYWR